MNHNEQPPTQPTGVSIGRRRFLAGAGTAGLAAGGALVTQLSDSVSAQAAPIQSPQQRGRGRRDSTVFGIGYETWFDPGSSGAGHVGWNGSEAKPTLGYYESIDPMVIRQHAEWIAGAGIDFVLIDLSNGLLDNIVAAAMKLLDIYTTLPRHPKVAFLLGAGSLASGVDFLESKVLATPAYAAMYQQFKGKPLLPIYRGPQFVPPASYDNADFTVRWMSAFHETTMNPWGDWSWLDRKPIINGPTTPVSPFISGSFGDWKADSNWSTQDADQFSHLPVATTQPAKGATTGTLTSPTFKITERVIQFIAAGADLTATEHTDWTKGNTIGGRNYYLLRDSDTGEVLRHEEPPGLITNGGNGTVPTGILTGSPYRLRQWDVGDLEGRSVYFQAVNNFTGAPFNWLAVSGLAQVAGEQMVAAVGNEGTAAPGWTGDWDALRRDSGATLVRYMRHAFRTEPDLVMVQQWNEFGPPDQFSVEESNDIEPTVLTTLDGELSDGWGTYYLDLVRSLISQYRAGNRIPQVKLDSRYP